MTEILALVGKTLIGVGLAFDLLGCLGLLRLPDVYNRLQAATKSVTLGTCSILLGVLLITGLNPTGMKAVLCILFLLLTSPVSAHAIARGSHRGGLALWERSVMDAYAEDQPREGPKEPGTGPATSDESTGRTT